MTERSFARIDLHSAIRRRLRGCGRSIRLYRFEGADADGWRTVASLPVSPDMTHVDIAREVESVAVALAGPLSRAHTALRVVFLGNDRRESVRIGQLTEVPKS